MSLVLASSVAVFSLKRFCPWPWRRIFFVSLASSLVSSTPPLLSTLVSIFRLGLLRLSADTYEATSSTAANVVSYLKRFRPSLRPFSLVMFRKRFSLA